MATQLDIIIESGATYQATYIFAGVNYQTHSMTMTLRRDHGSATALVTISTGAGGISVGGSGSSHTDVTCLLTATQTAALPSPMRGVYELTATLSGTTIRLQEGSFLTTPKVN